MTQDKQIVEDAVPVTTTANAGAGLVQPEKPITNTVFSRFREMKKLRKRDH